MGSYPDSPESLHTHQEALVELNPRWRELYEAAVLELDRVELLHCIELAEQEIPEDTATERVHHAPDEVEVMNNVALQASNLLRCSALGEMTLTRQVR